MGDEAKIEVLTPYARSLGIEVSHWDDNGPVLRVPFGEQLEGRPGALHGGAISGLLETAGYAILRARLAEDGGPTKLKPINVTVQFLRAGKTDTSFARGRIVKLGRRTANISVEAWQDDPDKVIASAVMNVMMVREDAA